MARRLILDTGVLIGAERGGRSLGAIIRPDDDLVIAAISLAELRAGIELGTPATREARERYLAGLLDRIPVEPYIAATAEAHGRLLARTRTAGRPRGAHDLIIAATAAATSRTIVTTDANARFDELPGVTAIVV